MSLLDDKAIVERIILRDEKTLLMFYQEHHRAVYTYVYKQLAERHLSEEVTQDIFLDFIEALRDFHFQSSLKTFLFSIARHKVIDVIRKKKIKKILFSALPQYIVEGLSTIIMDTELEQKELQEKIQQTTEQLPHDYQLILRLKYIEGEKVNTIAEKMKISFKATESLLFRARKAFITIFNSI